MTEQNEATISKLRTATITKADRSRYLPRINVLARLPMSDQAVILVARKRRLEAEAGRHVFLRPGDDRRRMMRSVRGRMRRLISRAHELGHWMGDEAS